MRTPLLHCFALGSLVLTLCHGAAGCGRAARSNEAYEGLDGAGNRAGLAGAGTPSPAAQNVGGVPASTPSSAGRAPLSAAGVTALPTAGRFANGTPVAGSGASAGTAAAGAAANSAGTTTNSAGTAGGAGQGPAAGGSQAGSGPVAANVVGPCDLYAAGMTPCVAAHSTVRALYGSYSGNLYQVRRASDKTTKDIAVLSPGGFANAAAQDTFCAGTTCTISIIYDQSSMHNHLTSAPAGGAVKKPDVEAKADALKLNVGGHMVYAVYVSAGTGYRNDKTSGVATGDQPEGEYMVTSGKHSNGGCCFDYGNAETTNNDDGAGTMEAVYFGSCTSWGKGSGSGPWVMADLENGLFAGRTFAANSSNTPLTSEYVTAMVKGKAGGFAIKGGDAQSGALKTMYDGARPNGYDPMKKQGALLLGIGGDNSNSGVGTFFEGCVTAGYPSDATDDAVQANIAAAGYGH